MASSYRLCNSSGSRSYRGRSPLRNRVLRCRRYRGCALISSYLHLSVGYPRATKVSTRLTGSTGLALFFTFMTVTEGGGRRAVARKFQDVYLPALKANFMLWPAVQILNFRVIPLQFQIVGSCNLNLRRILADHLRSRLFPPSVLRGPHTSPSPTPLTSLSERIRKIDSCISLWWGKLALA